MEIGAGTGLVGIVTAKLISDYSDKEEGTGGRVILSDYNPLVLDNIKRNIALNSLEKYAEASFLNFSHQGGNNFEGGWLETIPPGHDATRSRTNPREAVDMVLAADVICQHTDSVCLSKTIYDALKPGGKAIVTSAASAHRFGVESFQSECSKRGLVVIESSVVPDENSSEVYLSTSGFVQGMEMKMYEIVKPSMTKEGFS